VTGDFHFPDVQVNELVDAGDHDEIVARSAPVCDFCFDLRVRWEYPCEPFYLEKLEWGSNDEWLACEICSRYIERTMLRDLVSRQVASWRLRTGEPSWEQITNMRLILLAFLANRCGERKGFG
jgi:hypothetical protein